MALSNLFPPQKALPRPFWAGDRLPAGAGNKHFCVVGTTGSGKTITLQLLMQSVLPSLGESGADRRALIYDAKQDILSYLHTMVPNVPVLGRANALTLNHSLTVRVSFVSAITSGR